MRKYTILYRRGTGSWGKLTPGLHAGLYERREVTLAIDTLRANESFEGIAIRLRGEGYNVLVVLEPTTTDTFDF